MPRFTSTVLTSYRTLVCTLWLSILPCPEICSRQPVLLAFSHTLILLLLCSSGDVEVNPASLPFPRHSHLLTSVTPKDLVSCMLTLETSSLSLFYSLQPGCLNPGLGRPTKLQKSDKIELPKEAELQFTAEIVCRVLSYHPGLCPNNSSFYF